MEHDDVIYLDDAATSWPKPAAVIEAVTRSIERPGTPGRSSHTQALRASREMAHARRVAADFFSVHDSSNVVFQPGCTAGLNMLLKGLVNPGTRVLISPLEHNSVTRPLYRLSRDFQVEVVKIPTSDDGTIRLSALRKILSGSPVEVMAVQHASNVTGTIQPLGDIVDVAHEYGVKVIVDAAQTAGHIPIDFPLLEADALVCSGHKGLLGPTGVGLVVMDENLETTELIEGGTGSGGERSHEPFHSRPEAYEAGTPPLASIEGLCAGMEFLMAEGIDQRRTKETELVHSLMEGLLAIEGLRILGPGLGMPRVPLVSFVVEGVNPEIVAARLDREYGIATRSGLHCAPSAHERMGTLETGAVRMSLSADTPPAWIDSAVDATRAIVQDERL